MFISISLSFSLTSISLNSLKTLTPPFDVSQTPLVLSQVTPPSPSTSLCAAPTQLHLAFTRALIIRFVSFILSLPLSISISVSVLVSTIDLSLSQTLNHRVLFQLFQIEYCYSSLFLTSLFQLFHINSEFQLPIESTSLSVLAIDLR